MVFTPKVPLIQSAKSSPTTTDGPRPYMHHGLRPVHQALRQILETKLGVGPFNLRLRRSERGRGQPRGAPAQSPTSIHMTGPPTASQAKTDELRPAVLFLTLWILDPTIQSVLSGLRLLGPPDRNGWAVNWSFRRI